MSQQDQNNSGNEQKNWYVPPPLGQNPVLYTNKTYGTPPPPGRNNRQGISNTVGLIVLWIVFMLFLLFSCGTAAPIWLLIGLFMVIRDKRGLSGWLILLISVVITAVWGNIIYSTWSNINKINTAAKNLNDLPGGVTKIQKDGYYCLQSGNFWKNYYNNGTEVNPGSWHYGSPCTIDPEDDPNPGTNPTVEPTIPVPETTRPG